MKKQEVVQTAIILAKLQTKSKPILRKLGTLKVSNPTNYDLAGLHVKQLKEYGREAQKELDGIVVPLQGVIKKAKSLFQPFFNEIAMAEQRAKQDMILFQEKQKQLEVKLAEDFKAGKIKKVATMLEKQGDLKIKSANSSTRHIQVLEIKNPKLVPRKFLIPDTAEITRQLKDGKKVPGCELVEQTSIAI